MSQVCVAKGCGSKDTSLCEVWDEYTHAWLCRKHQFLLQANPRTKPHWRWIASNKLDFLAHAKQP